ncbi:Acyl transferase domain-containing protein [Micromonospora pallida]|uniref:Acyl transferase domain-containing protein n=1 Tax=Micromonospora pallida TaxID=145854 RepID=A0A1C6S1F6_9ACTN|nr:type I polyketide synthase [Micromonospora pallida]SCL23245.1 Acyl transferase domain-containing protein [Micromonospora pallida]
MAPERSHPSDPTPRSAAEPIAVIGLSCRFPGAGDADAFWRLLVGGGDAITEVPRDRWDADALFDADLAEPGTTNSRWGGFVDGVDRFDPHFFGVSPGEAASMDPQHRLLLEVTWEALERAGVVPGRLAGSDTGVYVGIGTDDYAQVAFADPADLNAYYVTGNALSLAVNRLSYLLDLHGPSLALDTGCSSSLVAVHLACQSLRSGETTVALAGGVNLMLSPKATIGLSQTWMMAADGRCKSFDAAADGYVRGEGCGMVVLKRLADARRDGDPVLAVIRGTAMNQNGRGEALTAPHAGAQQTVVRDALRDAGVTPEQVDLIEAHGVGTPLADVVEATALTRVFGADRDADRPCALGSVKTNIGHLEMAAGIASLIKVVLSLQHGTIPPHLHLDTINPQTGLADAPFVLPATPLPWPRADRPRLAGVNSFGLGGVNVHLVVAEPPADDASVPRADVASVPLVGMSSSTPAADRSSGPVAVLSAGHGVDAGEPGAGSGPLMLPLSARNAAALRDLAERYVTLLTAPDGPDFTAVCATAATGRTHFAHRLAVVAPDAPTAAARLDAWLAGTTDPDVHHGVHHGVVDPAEVVAGDPSSSKSGSRGPLLPSDASGQAVRYVRGDDPAEPGVGRLPRVVLPTYPFQRKRYWIESRPADRAERTAQVPELVRLVAEAVPAERRTRLADALASLVAETLGTEDDSPIDPRQGFFALGMTSLMAVNLQNRLQRALGDAYRLPLTLVFQYSSVAALTDHLAREVFGLDTPAPARALPAAPALTADALAALSEDEALSLLRRHLTDTATDLSPVKQALLALGRDTSVRPSHGEPIAVVGVGCRLPGGVESPAAFWDLLSGAVDTVDVVPTDRWDVDGFFDPDPDAPGKSYTRAGHFVAGVDGFDAGFFGVSPREAVSLDPQQRLLLEVAWEALEHAGQVPDQLAGTRTGVFVGLISNEYMQLQLKLGDPTIIDTYYGTGGIGSAVAGRLSYLLGLHGPSLMVDTACSSSLVSVHLACRSLRSGESDLALAGGVNLMIIPESHIFLSRARALSADGRCKTFDASADGYGRGEGCGVVVLKRLSDAQRDGDRVLAVIRGSAVNHDGPSSGLTVPNGLAQQDLIRAALADAGVAPADVDYVEAHGTGTPLGDPIEVAALGAVLGERRTADRPLLLGSVKANIGHLEAAAGVAGLIKSVLALQHAQLPPQVNFTTANPRIALTEIPAEIPVAGTPWPRGDRPRVAGVSSFGMSGTNAHLVVGEAPEPSDLAGSVAESGRSAYVLPLSARDGAALRVVAQRYADLLDGAEAPDFGLVCAAAAVTRSHFPHRLAVVASDSAAAAARLRGWLAGAEDRSVVHGVLPAGRRAKIGWLFTGQGAQSVGMARVLYESEPVFRAELDRCAELLAGELERPLLEVLFPSDGTDVLDQTGFTQPVLFAVEWSLAALWRHWGVQPDVVLGHSVGELVAACVAGVFSLEDGLRLVAARGRLMQALPAGGSMAAVSLPEEKVRPLLDGTGLVVAAVNSPTETVIAGPVEALDVVREKFTADGVKTTALHVSHAFHSPLMAPMLPRFREVAGSVVFRAPQRMVVSNVTGAVADAGYGSADYWVEHVSAPVRFADGMRTVLDQGCDVVQEVGPHPVLLAAGRQCVDDDTSVRWLPSLRRGRDDWQQLLTAVAALYAQGVALDWKAITDGLPSRAVDLPTYPFQRQRYWIDTSRLPQMRGSDDSDWLYQMDWQPQELPTEQGESGSDRWLIFADAGGVAESVAAALRARGDRCELVYPGDAYAALGDDAWQVAPGQPDHFRQLLRDTGVITGVVHLWSLDHADAVPEDLTVAHERSCASLLHLVQAVAPLDLAVSPRIWVVTSGAQAVAGKLTPAAPYQVPVWGLGNVIGLEHPSLWGGLIDLDPATDDPATAVVASLRSSGGENQIAWRDGRSHVARVVRAESARSDNRLEINADGTHLVTGGLGALGLLVARWLVERGARHVVLVGRRGPSEAAEETLASLTGQGAHVRVLRGDVGRADDVRAVLAEIETSMPPLRSVFHAAGVLDDGVLHQQSWDRFERVLAPKVTGAWHLHQITRDLPLDHFVLFSSIASLLGAPGQGNYAAANAFLDALAHHRHASGLPALSVNWGAWGDSGMAAALTDRDQQRWTARGIGIIPPERGIRLLERIMARSVPQVGVVPVDWTRYAEQYPLGANRPLLAELVRRQPAADPSPTAPAEGPGLRERYAAMRDAKRRTALTDHVTGELARILMLDEASLDPQKGLFDLGLDSLMALEFKNRVQATFDHEMPTTLLFNYPTVDAVVGYLDTVLFGQRQPEPESPPPTDSGDDLEALLDNLEQLSDDEIDRLFTNGSTAEGQA